MKSRTDAPGPFADLFAHFGSPKRLQKFLEEKSKKNSITKIYKKFGKNFFSDFPIMFHMLGRLRLQNQK